MKKGEIDYPIITFFFVVFGIILLAPIMMKMFAEIRSPIAGSFGNMSGSGGTIAEANVNKVLNTAYDFWDEVTLFAFLIALILLIISALFIDTNPVWIFLYIIISFMTILFAPTIMESLDHIYSSDTFLGEANSLSFMNYIRVHFAEFLVGVMAITGIIIYGKVALMRQGGRG